jgi:hypothetical protein
MTARLTLAQALGEGGALSTLPCAVVALNLWRPSREPA